MHTYIHIYIYATIVHAMGMRQSCQNDKVVRYPIINKVSFPKRRDLFLIFFF